MAYLSLFDASSLLYAGHKAKAYSPRSDTLAGDPVINGLPVGGVRYAIRYILNAIIRGDDVIVLFDSPTDRAKSYEDYKGTRTHDPAVYVQQLMLKDFVVGMKIPFLQVDNFEADDLVYSVMSTLGKKYYHHSIYSGDTDLAANIMDAKTTLIGVASIYPTITASNFEAVIKKGTFVPFNTILPYYLIWGKQSNNVAPFRDSKTNTALFSSFQKYCDSRNFQAGIRSSKYCIGNWLQDIYQKEETADFVPELLSRIDVVYPREYKEIPDFKFVKEADLNKDTLAYYLKCFGMDTMLSTYGCPYSLSEGRSKSMLDYLASYKRVFTSGTLAVDAGMSPDESYFSCEETDFFINEEDF